MRLSINLDSDLYAVAKSLARESDSSVSAAVNRLLRLALERQGPSLSQDPARECRSGRAGLPVVPCTRRFTSDDVYRIDNETA
jgi:hypothetical protein